MDQFQLNYFAPSLLRLSTVEFWLFSEYDVFNSPHALVYKGIEGHVLPFSGFYLGAQKLVFHCTLFLGKTVMGGSLTESLLWLLL